MRCVVLPHSKSPGIGNGLSYDGGTYDLKPGYLVRVPLRNKSVEGIVLTDEEERAEEYQLKQVTEILHATPLLSEAQLKTMRWMAGYYHTTLRQALTPFLPSPPWQSLIPKDIVGYRVGKPFEKGGTKQEIVMDYMQSRDWTSKAELKSAVGASAQTIATLVKNGHLIEEKRLGSAPQFNGPYDVKIDQPLLTQSQHEAYLGIKADPRPSLLFGITSSGKTEVYAALMSDAAREGKQTILLVPEILLTEHIIHRFEALFERDRIAVLHSRLTPASRRKEWMRIHSGEAALVIGSRSALFAPCRNLGLIIIDEEHEWTYKNEQTPRYHARETAETLAKYAGAKLLLGSATPSLEAWSRAKNGQYHLARLPERYQRRPLPNVRVIDLTQAEFGNFYPFSVPLLAAIEKRLKAGEQSVLFLNRRGIATSILCMNCKQRLMSPDSQLPYTMHRTPSGRPFLLDHFSGKVEDLPAGCPHCGMTQLRAVGAGTQKIEDLLAQIFPSARLLRADSDTLRHPEQMRLLLKKMRERQADILLGTQSVVKGLDLPEVTLAAVLVADVGLSLPHFRAGERVVQLLTQLTGRSGRSKAGEVIIQTFRPEALEIVAAANHATEEYLEQELKLRIAHRYPPSTDMIRFIIDGANAGSRAKILHAQLLRLIRERSIAADAMCAPTLFSGGRVWHILLRGTNLRPLLGVLDLTDVTVDIDPIDCI